MTMTYSLLGLAIGAGLAYLPMTGRDPSLWRSVVKTVPLACLALLAARMGPPFLAAALALSALGDLALSRPGKSAFLYGLTAFALAHLVYILLFLDHSGADLSDPFTTAPIAAIALIALALSTELWLAPHADGMAWPVRAYVVLITVMALTALMLDLSLALAGAFLFLASDLALAIQVFRLGGKGPRPLHWAIWGLYLTGQILIALAFMPGLWLP